MAKDDEFSSLQELEHGPLVLLNKHQLSVLQLLHYLTLAVLDLAL